MNSRRPSTASISSFSNSASASPAPAPRHLRPLPAGTKRARFEDTSEHEHTDSFSGTRRRRTYADIVDQPHRLLDEQDDDSQEDEGEDTSSTPRATAICSDTIVSILVKGTKVGCAVYDPSSASLQLMEDADTAGHSSAIRMQCVILDREAATDELQLQEQQQQQSHIVENEGDASDAATKRKDLITMVLEQNNPDLVLASSSCPDDSLQDITHTLRVTGGEMQVRPKHEFQSQAGKTRLLSSGILGVGKEEHTGDADVAEEEDDASAGAAALPIAKSAAGIDEEDELFVNRMRLNAAVDLDSMDLTCGAACALLAHLSRVVSHDELPGKQAPLGILSIETLKLDAVMQVTCATQRALSVFNEEHATGGGASKTKEGLSLFSLLNWTSSSLGKMLLRRWLTYPSADRKTIEMRHEAVACMVHPQNAADAVLLAAELKNGVNLPMLMTGSFVRNQPALSAWKKLRSFCTHAMAIRGVLVGLKQPSSMLTNIAQSINAEKLARIVDSLEVIDFQESALERTVTIVSGYDAQLDEKRRMYAALPSLLNRIANELRGRRSIHEYAKNMYCVYFPQLGFLISLPQPENQTIEEASQQEIEGLTFKFASNLMTYWKSEEMDDLDYHFGDLHTAILERQLEVLSDLQQSVLVQQHVLVKAAQALAELDVILSFARAAQEYSWVRPVMTDENVISIKDGRHPLSELCVESFVANDTELHGGQSSGLDHDTKQSSVIVVTGPNCSGKSVYIKSIAVSIYMAQCGAFVPASEATIGICDKLLTSIQVVETVSKLQSNFLIDASQVTFALRQSTSRSLILLDETARGTNANDGAGLFAAVMQEFLSRGSDCPKLAVATHFHEVFRSGLLPRNQLNFTPKHMQIVFDDSDNQSNEIVYIFKAMPGFAQQSYAAHCAQMYGIDETLVRRGEYVTNLLRDGRAALLAFEGLESDDEDEMEERSPIRRCVVDRDQLLKLEEIVRAFIEWDIEADVEDLSIEDAHTGKIRRRLMEVLNSTTDDQMPSENVERIPLQ